MKGVATGDMGHRPRWRAEGRLRAGHGLHARLHADCRRRARQPEPELDERNSSCAKASTRKYGIGMKELWEIDPAKHQPGLVMHSQGWPLLRRRRVFLYHLENNQVMVGFVVHLNYDNPHLSPYDEFQRFKTHPAIRTFFEGGGAFPMARAPSTKAACSPCPKTWCSPAAR